MTGLARVTSAAERQALALELVRDQSMGLIQLCLTNVERQVRASPEDVDLSLRALKAASALLPRDVTVTASAGPDLGRQATVQSVERLLALADAHRAQLLGNRAPDVVEGEVVDFEDLL